MASTRYNDRTRNLARIIGPALVIIPSIMALRAPDLGTVLEDFFANQALVWMGGSILILAGLIIIALHQIWSSVSAALVSLFGWLLLLRGVVLLTAPELFHSAGIAVVGQALMIQIGFALLILAGLWLSYTGWLDRHDS